MNILLTTPSGNGKLIQGGTIQDGVTLANSLGLTQYNVGTYTAASVVVNDSNGTAFNVSLNDGGSPQRFLIFDTSSSNVLTWISTNYPTATVVSFGKTPMILASA
jgi:hypothetical protein